MRFVKSKDPRRQRRSSSVHLCVSSPNFQHDAAAALQRCSNLLWDHTGVEGYLRKWSKWDHRQFPLQGEEREKKPPAERGDLSLFNEENGSLQSSCSLRLWCLSMLSTHSMIQNILKYRTVIVDLQNIRPRVPRIYSRPFFSFPFVAGGLRCLQGKVFKGIPSLS